MAYSKSRANFDSIMKGEVKIGDSYYEATTAKRKTLAIPIGVRVFDTDLKKIFIGDGTTYGGVSERSRLVMRRVHVPAAASGATYTSGVHQTGNAGTFVWANASGLRTGDSVTIASGTGTLPSGVAANTYFIRKTGDKKIGGDETNTGTRFYLHSTALTALGSSATSGLVSGATSGASGASFTLVIADVNMQDEDILYMYPVASAVDVVLPYPGVAAMSGYSVTVKAGGGNSAAVTIKAFNSSTVAGTFTVNNQASQSITLGNNNSGGFVTLLADPERAGYIIVGQSDINSNPFNYK